MTFQSILLCASRPFGAQGSACAPERNPHVSFVGPEWMAEGRVERDECGNSEDAFRLCVADRASNG